jgi:hypothetical protein
VKEATMAVGVAAENPYKIKFKNVAKITTTRIQFQQITLKLVLGILQILTIYNRALFLIR